MHPEIDKSHIRGGRPRKTEQQYAYWWPGMLVGTKKLCDSPVDALIEVLMRELKIKHVTTLFAELKIPDASVSRCRRQKMEIPEDWLMKAAIISGFSYTSLCELIGREPKFCLYITAPKLKEL